MSKKIKATDLLIKGKYGDLTIGNYLFDYRNMIFIEYTKDFIKNKEENDEVTYVKNKNLLNQFLNELNELLLIYSDKESENYLKTLNIESNFIIKKFLDISNKDTILFIRKNLKDTKSKKVKAAKELVLIRDKLLPTKLNFLLNYFLPNDPLNTWDIVEKCKKEKARSLKSNKNKEVKKQHTESEKFIKYRKEDSDKCEEISNAFKNSKHINCKLINLKDELVIYFGTYYVGTSLDKFKFSKEYHVPLTDTLKCVSNIDYVKLNKSLNCLIKIVNELGGKCILDLVELVDLKRVDKYLANCYIRDINKFLKDITNKIGDNYLSSIDNFFYIKQAFSDLSYLFGTPNELKVKELNNFINRVYRIYKILHNDIYCKYISMYN